MEAEALSNINYIQSKIKELDGGTFQKLFDIYLYKKFKFKNIQTLGVQDGTNKTTKGIPDSYVLTDDGKYILINYGSMKLQHVTKIKRDILSCFDQSKVQIPEDKIKKIICGHCSTNINIKQLEDIKDSIKGVEIELIGIDTLSHDLALYYPHIAKDHLNISIDTNQIFDVEDFMKAYDATDINAPLNCELLYREPELLELCNSLEQNRVTILTGPSGIGKTRLALEACKKLDAAKTQVLCVKNNGNLLYEDIKYYISDSGRYLLFLDDANMVVSLENVLNTILMLPSDIEVKLLISVRDYAKTEVVDVVSRYLSHNIIEIKRLKDSEIKGILKSNLGILNSDYLEKISAIADGNIRLAVLAGIGSKDEGYQAIRNAEDIFRNYYGRIIKEADLEKEDILMLFFIAIAGPVKNNGNKFYSNLKKLYGEEIIENDKFEYLYSLELIDWFQKEITKITDQSFANYILYYVLYEKRWINLESLITLGFPTFRKKILYALNTLMIVFNSEKCSKYIKDAINAAWDNAPPQQEMEYLKSFYQVNLDKSLYIIKKLITKQSITDCDLSSFDFDSKKNNFDINTIEIEILGGFKHTERFDDAVDLLMLYFKKRPDLIMDVYFVLSRMYLYDKYSYKHKYSHEMRLIEKLWLYTDKGEDYNNSILYLHVVDYALKTEVHFIEQIRNSRNMNYITMTLGFTEEISEIRTHIWKSIAILRKNEKYKDIVNAILLRNYSNQLSKHDLKRYIKSDFNNIYAYVINKKAPDFFDAKVLVSYKRKADKIDVKTDNRYMVYEQNPEYRMFKILAKEFSNRGTIEEWEQLRKESIRNEINGYDLENFRELFRICNSIEKKINNRELYLLTEGLDFIFELIEYDKELYFEVIREYFNANTPCKLQGCRQIKYMLNNSGYKLTYNFINENIFDMKNSWLLLLWELVPEDSLNKGIINDCKTFILNHRTNKNPIIPTFKIIVFYGERDSEFKQELIKIIANNPKVSAVIFRDAHNDYDIGKIINFFKNDMDALVSIYINSLSSKYNIDYDGKLFEKIFKQRCHIWEKYVNWIKTRDSLYKNYNEEKIFEFMWHTDNWRNYIEYAFNVLIDDVDFIYSEEYLSLLFEGNDNSDIFKRKKCWLNEKLRENSLNIEKCKKLIYAVVCVIPDWKLKYVIDFLMINKSVDDFKKIYLFPLSYSWSGSEIPIVIERINFLKSLNDCLKGIDYIEHRKYLEEYCRDLEKRKKELEIREYLEDSDYI